MALSARGFDVAESLGFQECAADNGCGLLTIGVDGRDSSGTVLNEGANVFGAPNACFAEFHWFRCVPAGDPGVPQGSADRDDARRSPLRIGDKISYAQESRIREDRSDLGLVCGRQGG